MASSSSQRMIKPTVASPQKRIKWHMTDAMEWIKKGGIPANIPEYVQNYQMFVNLAKTHLNRFIRDYQLLAMQLTLEITEKQRAKTLEILKKLKEYIFLMTVNDMSSTQIVYVNITHNIRRWYDETNHASDINKYKAKYVLQTLPYQFIYDDVDTPALMAAFRSINGQKFNTWMNMRMRYLPQFMLLWTRIQKTNTAMKKKKFEYTSPDFPDYASIVNAITPHIRTINIYIIMFNAYSPKEKTNLYEFDAYLTVPIIVSVLETIRSFLNMIGILPNTLADIHRTHEQWNEKINQIMSLSQKAAFFDVKNDKRLSFDTARDKWLLDVKKTRENVASVITKMDQKKTHIMNPFYTRETFASMFRELTSVYYSIDAYFPLQGTVDEYTNLSKSLETRLPAITDAIEKVIVFEELPIIDVAESEIDLEPILPVDLDDLRYIQEFAATEHQQQVVQTPIDIREFLEMHGSFYMDDILPEEME